MSAGSLIAFRTALSHPSYVNGIVALSSTCRSASQAAIDAFGQVYQAWIATPTPSEDIMNIAIKGWGGDLDVNSDRCKIIKWDWTTRYNGAVNVEAIADCLNSRDDIVGKLKDIKVPMLLIQGEKDITWTVEEAEIASDALPNAELKVIPGGGHMLIFARKADDVNYMIGSFLKEHGY
jgi:pimeloyl-ACP methyl ester carboxylesterase